MDSTFEGTQELLIDVADIVSHKWHPVILYQLLSQGPLSYSELQNAVRGISSKMLSESLTTLEEQHLIHRELLNEKPVRVQYSLTTRGHAFETILIPMLRWGTEYIDGAPSIAIDFQSQQSARPESPIAHRNQVDR